MPHVKDIQVGDVVMHNKSPMEVITPPVQVVLTEFGNPLVIYECVVSRHGRETALTLAGETGWSNLKILRDGLEL